MNVMVERLEIGVLDLETLLASEAPHYPFEKEFVTVQNDLILVIHSSGTTGKSMNYLSFVLSNIKHQIGNPKIITMTHGTLPVTDNDRFVGCPNGRKLQNGAQFNFMGGGGFYSWFPPYHLGCVLSKRLEILAKTPTSLLVFKLV
jgi:hypothetical protein